MRARMLIISMALVFLVGCEPVPLLTDTISEQGVQISDEYNEPLEVPSHIYILDRTPGSLTVRWLDRSENEIGFRLERRTRDGDWHTVHRMLHADPRRQPETLAQLSSEPNIYYTYKDDNLSENTTYCYRATAFNQTDTSYGKERCWNTLPEPKVVFKQELPSIAQPIHTDIFEIIGDGNADSCTNPLLPDITDVILDGIGDSELDDLVKSEFLQHFDSSTCGDGGGWGIISDIWEEIKDLKQPAVCSTALGVTAVTCSAEVFLCLKSLVTGGGFEGNGGDIVIQGCKKPEIGDVVCEEPQKIEGGFFGDTCLVLAGLIVSDADPCVKAAKWVGEACEISEDE